MAFSPIAFIAPYYRKFNGYWLKTYEPGTTTPKPIAVDSNGSGQAAKLQINEDGFLLSSGGAIVTPFIDGAYDAYLFPTETEADNNNTINAERVADNLEGVDNSSKLSIADIGDYASYEFDTVANAKLGVVISGETVTLKENDVIRIKERRSSLFDVISGTSGSNGFNIIAHATLNLSFVLRINNVLYANEFGVDSTADATAALSAFFDVVIESKTLAVLEPVTYNVSGSLLSDATPVEFYLTCYGGKATINYTGAALGRLMLLTDCQNALVENVIFDCADLVAAPIDIRRATGFGGKTEVRNVDVNNAKQTGAITVNPIGIFVSGSYSNVVIESCNVNGVAFDNVDRNSTGIGVSNFGGVASIRNNTIKNVTTSSGIDADGIKVFGSSTDPTAFLGAIAEIHNNVISNCQGRMIKMQISDFEIHGNRFIIEAGFSTITEWRCIDSQFDNGNIHDNSVLIGSSLMGANSTLFVLQNNKNDGNGKASHLHSNRVSLTGGANVLRFASCGATNGTSVFRIENNEVLSDSLVNGLKRGIAFVAAGGAAQIERVALIYRENIVTDYVLQDLFDPFTEEDYTDKLYLEVVDNNVLNPESISRLTGSIGLFKTLKFRVSNNTNTLNLVQWEFDCDELLDGNDIYTSNQTILNKYGPASDFSFFTTDGFTQRNTSTTGTIEGFRTSTNGSTWFAWVAVR